LDVPRGSAGEFTMTSRQVMFEIEKAAEVFPIKQNFADTVFEWGRELDRQGIVSGQEGGSLSYRHGLGFVITARDANLHTLVAIDLVFVERWDFSSGRVTIRGRQEPPPESLLHAVIYQNRGGAIFTVFTRSRAVLKAAGELGLPVTDHPQALDTPALASEVEGKLGRGNMVIVRNEGVLSFGCTVEDASRQVLTLIGNRKLRIAG